MISEAVAKQLERLNNWHMQQSNLQALKKSVSNLTMERKNMIQMLGLLLLKQAARISDSEEHLGKAILNIEQNTKKGKSSKKKNSRQDALESFNNINGEKKILNKHKHKHASSKSAEDCTTANLKSLEKKVSKRSDSLNKRFTLDPKLLHMYNLHHYKYSSTDEKVSGTEKSPDVEKDRNINEVLNIQNSISLRNLKAKHNKHLAYKNKVKFTNTCQESILESKHELDIDNDTQKDANENISQTVWHSTENTSNDSIVNAFKDLCSHTVPQKNDIKPHPSNEKLNKNLQQPKRNYHDISIKSVDSLANIQTGVNDIHSDDTFRIEGEDMQETEKLLNIIKGSAKICSSQSTIYEYRETIDAKCEELFHKLRDSLLSMIQSKIEQELSKKINNKDNNHRNNDEKKSCNNNNNNNNIKSNCDNDSNKENECTTEMSSDRSTTPACTPISSTSDELPEKRKLIQLRLIELEKEITAYKENNLQLKRAKQEHELEKKHFRHTCLAAEKRLKDEKIVLQIYMQEERNKINKEKLKLEEDINTPKMAVQSKGRLEITRLKAKLSEMQNLLKNKIQSHAIAQARLRSQIRNLEKDQKILQVENERLSHEYRKLANDNYSLGNDKKCLKKS